jgi:hypothetical protein
MSSMVEKSALQLLDTFGLTAIWDVYLAATAAYDMGKIELAASLVACGSCRGVLDAAGGNGRYLITPLHLISSRPATLGSTLAAHLALIVWCKSCGHQVEPDVAELVERYGAGLTLVDWAARLVCSRCGSRETISW